MTKDERSPEEAAYEHIEKLRAVYSDSVVLHGLRPENAGSMNEPDGYGRILGTCGDTMIVFLRVTGARIEQASFQTDGCLVRSGVRGRRLRCSGKRENENLRPSSSRSLAFDADERRLLRGSMLHEFGK